jgi:hypothetical protein
VHIVRARHCAACCPDSCNRGRRERVFIYEAVGKYETARERVKVMVGKKKDREFDERLDQIGRELVRASAASETEADDAASSPFLYARVRARIAAERERHEAGESWLALLGVVWRAVPAMALVAVFAFAMFWTANLGTLSTASFSFDSLLDTRDAGIEQVVFADSQPLSSDEVLATILTTDERETAR